LVRSRVSIVAALVLLSLGLLVALPTAASASGKVFAQDVGEGEEDAQPGEDQPSGESEDGEGQGDAESQTDPEAGGEEGESETGPPWTYQMAWMGMALGFVVIGLIGFMYWRLVVRRSRGVA
jgi:hypothetical protein